MAMSFAAVVGLGALGVVTSITLRVQPTFDVEQHVFEFLPVEELKGHFEEDHVGRVQCKPFHRLAAGCRQ